jgi:thermostable 8-oxoguanine DNA glycosylase
MNSVLMYLTNYTDLIKQLPYEQQAFETRKETWGKYKSSAQFGLFFNEIFKSNKVSFSRGELFMSSQNDFNSAVFSIVLWGYPRNMRGNSFSEVLKHLDVLKEMINEKNRLTTQEFLKIRNDFKGTGIGLSTLTKFLYFFNLYVDGYRCLILDRRIINVLSGEKFAELASLKSINEFNKEKLYVDYLKVMNDISNKLGYKVDQLELFLFMFGNNLKVK